MTETTRQHGTKSNCRTCGAEGVIESAIEDDQGPENDNWIGSTGGRDVCHACESEEQSE